MIPLNTLCSQAAKLVFLAPLAVSPQTQLIIVQRSMFNVQS